MGVGCTLLPVSGEAEVRTIIPQFLNVTWGVCEETRVLSVYMFVPDFFDAIYDECDSGNSLKLCLQSQLSFGDHPRKKRWECITFKRFFSLPVSLEVSQGNFRCCQSVCLSFPVVFSPHLPECDPGNKSTFFVERSPATDPLMAANMDSIDTRHTERRPA